MVLKLENLYFVDHFSRKVKTDQTSKYLLNPKNLQNAIKSEFDIINTFKEFLNTNINYNITNRRDGDLPKYFAATSKAEKYLRWKANKSLLDMCTDSLRWQKNYNIK